MDNGWFVHTSFTSRRRRSNNIRNDFKALHLIGKLHRASFVRDGLGLEEHSLGHCERRKKKVWFYIALYPVRWTAQSALHFPPLADLFIPTPFSASLGSILAMQQLRNDYSLTFPPLSIARYSFIQLSRLRRREVKENAQTSKR